jgi:exopolysaccharide production protein ExoQ
MTTVIISPVMEKFLNILIFLFIPLSIISPHTIVLEVILGGLIGLYYSRKFKLTEIPNAITIALLAIPSWGMITTLWAKYPLDAVLMNLKIFALIILGIYWCRLTLSIPVYTRQALTKSLISGLFVGIFFFIVDTIKENPWQNYCQKSPAKAFAQGSLMFSLAAWPAILWATKRPYSLPMRICLVGCLLLSIFWVLYQIDCDTSPIGLMLGLCAFIGTISIPRISSFSMRLFIPLFAIVFPLISYYAFKPEYIPSYNKYIHSPSYIDRLYLWNEVSSTIFEHPWLGIGMNGTPHHDKSQVVRKWSYIDKQGNVKETQSTKFARHPHNAILQLWLELGFIGVFLGILIIHLSLHQIFRANLNRIEKAVCAGLFMGIFSILWVNLGIWQNWWISGLWIIIGLTIMSFKNKRNIDEVNLS